jgi:diaminopropionate ammonia-lyase
MFIDNRHADYRKPLDPRDTETLGVAAADRAERYLAHRDDHQATPLLALPAMARELDVKSIHIKDEGLRLGLGSFKALGGSYAVIRLALEGAARRLGRSVDIDELHAREVCDFASRMTFGCATDGNHGRSVAQGAQLVGAKSAIFVHAGVSDRRIAAIASFGGEIIRVDGAYDDAVAEASRVCAQNGWTIVSDTSWPGYERIPGLVMQGYTAMVREALRALPAPPTHVFIQAGVGGLAAAVAGHLAIIFGDERPIFVVVEPSRAACVFQSARAGYPHKIAHDEPTVMAMLECYEPSLVAWRILSRVADGFLTVEEEDAIAVMNRLARPAGEDPAIIAGESGGVGLAGLIRAAADPHLRALLELGAEARVFLINTEGATDPERYRELVSPDRPTSPPGASA